MSFKSWFDRRMGKGIQAEQINANDSRSHSRAYHRFFAGYTEVKKVKQGGLGYTIDRVYTGQYYHRLMGRRKSLVVKLLYAAMTAAAAALFISASITQVESNGVWYVVLPEAASIAALVWTCTGVGNYLLGPERMTVYEYRSSSGRIKRASLCALAAFCLAALTSALWLALHAVPASIFRESVSCIVKLLGGGALFLMLNRVECAIKYEKVISEMNGRVNGVEIK